MITKDIIAKLNFLIDDEYEAIDGYDEVIKFLDDGDVFTGKDVIIKQLEHIKDEEDEHIRELSELKRFVLNPNYAPDLDTLKESKGHKSIYRYEGPIMRFGKVVMYDWEAATQASSPKEAYRNFIFKAGKALGYDVGSHNYKVEIDRDGIYEIDQEDDGYFDEDVMNTPKHCPECGSLLTDGGYCPKCDDGDDN